ncbi:MAG: hypothetical protein E7183_03860 [Erysipelotrichaceae bacterium]|nr:hypothetical protein [Erysipelotrichaceae bacterium]
MIILFNEEVKVILDSNKHVTIKNFKELKSINDDYILVDNYLLIGSLLKITILDESYIEVYGKITEIKIVD